MTLTPIQFGEAIKVEGERASSASARLEEQYKAEGKTAVLVTPQITNGDTLVLTDEQAEGYYALMDAQRKKAVLMLAKYLPVELFATLTGKSKTNNPENYGFGLRLMKRVSDKIVAASKSEFDALFASPRVVQAEDILSAEPQAESGASAEPLVSEVTDATFDQDVRESDVPVLVDFWAPWCGPCKSIAPLVEDLAQQYNGKFKVVKINVDENPEIPKLLGIQGIPQLLLFNRGEEIARQVGSVPRKTLESFVRKNLPTGPGN